jgi:hypothetical protein
MSGVGALWIAWLIDEGRLLFLPLGVFPEAVLYSFCFLPFALLLSCFYCLVLLQPFYF